jgi:hypothetical protein
MSKQTLARIVGIAIGIIVLAFLFYEFIIVPWLSNSPSVSIAWYLILAVICGLAGYLFRLGKRLKFAAAPARVSADDRAPVLYLRMFRDDQVAQQGRGGDNPASFHLGFETEEERLVNVLDDFGPVIALGRPGEKLPGLGASREYVEHDEWQQRVHAHMKQAALVVLRLTPFAAESLIWEFQEAMNEVAPERLVLLVPKPHSYEAFRPLANKVEPSRPLPPYPESALRKPTLGEKLTIKTVGGFMDTMGTPDADAPLTDMQFMTRWVPFEWFITALIYFKPDGTPCFEPFFVPKSRRFNIATAL